MREFRVTKANLSPVPSAVFTRSGTRTTSENADSEENGGDVRPEQVVTVV